MISSGPPKDLDDESIARVARSFYVVRMVRYGLLTLASLGVAALSAAQGAPVVVPIVLVALAAVLAASMVAVRRHYVSSQQQPSAGPSSPSPTG
jgi:hypothetical protein